MEFEMPKKVEEETAPTPEPCYEDLVVLEDFTIYDAEKAVDIKVEKGARIHLLSEDKQMKALRAYPDLLVLKRHLEAKIHLMQIQLSKIHSSRLWRKNNGKLAE